MNAATLPQQWISKHFDKLVTTCNGYNRLKSVKISRVCQNFSTKIEDDNILILAEKQQNISATRNSSKIDEKCPIEKQFDASVSVRSDKIRSDNKREASLKLRSFRGRSKKCEIKKSDPVITPVILTFDKSTKLQGKNMSQVPKVSELLEEFDTSAFERQQRQLLLELHRKRSALDECRQQLNEVVYKQQESERLLSIEKRKKETDESQNKLMKNFMKVLEEESAELKTTNNKLQVEVAMLTSERDSLREQFRLTQLENIKFKRLVEDYELKQKYHSVYETDINEQQTRLKTSILHLKNMMQTLKKHQENVRELDNISNVCAELKLLNQTLRKDKEKAIEERDKLEEECIHKTAELSQLKDLLQNSPLIISDHKQNSFRDYWMNCCKELGVKLTAEKKTVLDLTEDLNVSNENQMKLQKHLKAVMEENDGLIERLKKFETEKIDTSIETKKEIEEAVEDECT